MSIYAFLAVLLVAVAVDAAAPGCLPRAKSTKWCTSPGFKYAVGAGMQLVPGGLKLNTADECQKACAARTDCLGYVFDNMGEKLCHIKQFDPCDVSTHVAVNSLFILGYPC